ncbi:hypothetical protein D3C85_1002520 [compost metagenome]
MRVVDILVEEVVGGLRNILGSGHGAQQALFHLVGAGRLVNVDARSGNEHPSGLVGRLSGLDVFTPVEFRLPEILLVLLFGCLVARHGLEGGIVALGRTPAPIQLHVITHAVLHGLPAVGDVLLFLRRGPGCVVAEGLVECWVDLEIAADLAGHFSLAAQSNARSQCLEIHVHQGNLREQCGSSLDTLALGLRRVASAQVRVSPRIDELLGVRRVVRGSDACRGQRKRLAYFVCRHVVNGLVDAVDVHGAVGPVLEALADGR